MSGATFGRKGGGPDAEMAARRAAFLAAERARASAAPSDSGHGRNTQDSFARPLLAERPNVSRKTMGTAYLLWFFLCGLSAHRFYLGFWTSAIIQVLLMPIGYAMLLSKSQAGLLFVPVAGLWMLADGFLIPSMVRKANERASGLSLTSTFA